MSSQPPENVYTRLAARLREERHRQGLTLEALAASAGISTAFLAYIEQERRKPSLVTAAKLAKGLGVPLPDLFKEPKSGAPSYKVPEKLAGLIQRATVRQRGTIYKVVEAIVSKKPKD